MLGALHTKYDGISSPHWCGLINIFSSDHNSASSLYFAMYQQAQE